MDNFVGTGSPVTQAVFTQSIATLGCTAPSLWAVLATETSGCGFLPDRRPKILFERHIFHRLTHGQYDAQDPDVSAPTQGGYGIGGAHQYDRLHAAILLDETAALQSASWGLGQILGLNCVAAGFAEVEAMVAAFVASEDGQLTGMANFIASSSIKSAIASQNWARFARLYNGADYAKNNYDGHLATFSSLYTSHGCPSLDIRAAQILLSYRGYAVGTIDGVWGTNTSSALAAFRKEVGLPGGNGAPDEPTLEKLAQ